MKKIVKQNYQILASYCDLSLDEESGAIYGVANGFSVLLTAPSSSYPYQFSLVIAARAQSGELTEAQLKEFSKNVKTIGVLSHQQYTFQCVIRSTAKIEKLQENVKLSIQAVTDFLRASGYVNCCQTSGRIGETSACYMNQTYMLLCEEAYTQMSQSINAQQQKHKQKKENVLTGIVGALLGSVIGAVAIVVIGQLGYVAAISGLIMAVCTLKGYELLGGKLSICGVIVSCILMLVVPFVANNVDWALLISRELELDFATSFQVIPLLLEDSEVRTEYYQNLFMVYAFVLVGAVPTIWQSFKSQKGAGRVYQMGKGM